MERKAVEEPKETKLVEPDDDILARNEQCRSISLFRLFLIFVRVGIITIGGGYVMVPLLREEFVEKRKLMSTRVFCNIMALAQAGPGGVAINASTVVGYKVRGVVGAVVATIGTVVPSFLVIVLLSAWLMQSGRSQVLNSFLMGAKPAVVGLLIVAALSLGKEVIEDKMGILLAIGAFLGVAVFGIHPVLLISLAGLAGFLYYRKRVQPDDESCDNESCNGLSCGTGRRNTGKR